MEIRNNIHPEHAKHLTTQELRRAFLIESLFETDQINLTYCHIDRVIIGGALPVKPLTLVAGKKITGSDFLLERRELGLINVGGPGNIIVDEQKFDLDTEDGIYIGRGSRIITMASFDSKNPAKFYMLSAPAHKSYPVKKIKQAETEQLQLGNNRECNTRLLCKYIHPAQVPSCQLVMGVTKLENANVWNTMPCHTHERRMEVYFYFNVQPQSLVLHLMGEPQETRHIIVRNEHAVIGPSWSIHSGVGTQNYSFIWGMLGENQTFDDMDDVPILDMK